MIHIEAVLLTIREEALIEQETEVLIKLYEKKNNTQSGSRNSEEIHSINST